jgi:beta-lactam-binding protein with PASTA domain
MKTKYKNFSLNERVALIIDQKTDAGEVIPAGTEVTIIHNSDSLH